MERHKHLQSLIYLVENRYQTHHSEKNFDQGEAIASMAVPQIVKFKQTLFTDHRSIFNNPDYSAQGVANARELSGFNNAYFYPFQRDHTYCNFKNLLAQLRFSVLAIQERGGVLASLGELAHHLFTGLVPEMFFSFGGFVGRT